MATAKHADKLPQIQMSNLECLPLSTRRALPTPASIRLYCLVAQPL